MAAMSNLSQEGGVRKPTAAGKRPLQVMCSPTAVRPAYQGEGGRGTSNEAGQSSSDRADRRTGALIPSEPGDGVVQEPTRIG